MSSEIIQPQDQDAPGGSSHEVDFALVLSRMIDSVNTDPEHLRATIYELARHKLQEQLKSESSAESRRVSKSLEVAIKGVEAFRLKNGDTAAALPRPEPTQQPLLLRAPQADAQPQPIIDAEVSKPTFGRLTRSTSDASKIIWRFAGVLAVVVAVILAVRLMGITGDTLRTELGRHVSVAAPTAPKRASVSTSAAEREKTPAAAPEPSPTVPTSYGIYAVSQEKLYELQLLPGRAPDMRVAISSAITLPSRTTLPNGQVRFIVYRRDSATNAADRAEIRIIAKIEREMGFDAAGKPIVSKVDDSWVIRNISIPYRTAPHRDNPDMYEVQSENAEAALPPGRYALVLKGQAYDFSVAGALSDPRQCLERLAATNGQFYSECKKQP